ncbi:MAG: hypothetical protein JW909_00865 [Planctomycetes bacterium]|nr:hypothetical protein [Planctomycetota bacterium]
MTDTQKTSVLSVPLSCHDELESTQDEVKSLLRSALPDCAALPPWKPVAAVAARHQRRGRGRLSRSWVDSPGSMLVSIGFLDDLSIADLPVLFSHAAALAVRQSVDSCSDVRPSACRIKWPNDVVLPHGKLAGVLAETVALAAGVRGTVIGIGVNVLSAPPDLPGAASVSDVASADVSIEAFRNVFLAELDAILADISSIKERFSSGLVLPQTVFFRGKPARPTAYDSGRITLQFEDSVVTVDEARINVWEG